MLEVLAAIVGYKLLGSVEFLFPRLKWALIRPAVSWLYTALLLGSGAPTVFKFLAIPHGIVALLYITTYRHDIAARYLHLPCVGSLAAYAVSHFAAPRDEERAGRLFHAAMVVLALHLHRIGVAVVRTMIFPAPLLGYFVDIQRARASLLSATSTTELQLINSPSGHLIDVMIFRNAVEPRPSTWVVYLGGNGEVYEHSGHTAITLAQSLKANAMCFNFRGVGRSTGSILRAADLVSDATVALTHLLEKVDPSTTPRKVLLYGHSIGGGVAAQVVACHFPEMSLVVDRSFSSLSDAARSFVAPLRSYPRFVQWGVDHAFGELDTGAVWGKIGHKRKLVTFHAGDQIIRFAGCSLARLSCFDSARTTSGSEVIELTGQVSDPHNVPSYLLHGHRDVIARMQDFLHGRTLHE